MRKNAFSHIHNRLLPRLTLVLPLLLAASGWCGEPEKVAASMPASSPGKAAASRPASSVAEAGKVPSEYAKAIDAAMQLPVGEERLKAFVTVGIEWSQKDPIPAMSWASKLKRDLFPPNPTLQVPMKVSYALGKGKDVGIVADWFISPKCDAGEKGHWFYDLIQMWGEVDSNAALAWALRMPKDTDADLRFKCFLGLGNGWIARVKKSGGSLDGSELFSKMEPGDDRLAAVMGAATKRTDIPTATAWVKNWNREKPGSQPRSSRSNGKQSSAMVEDETKPP